MKKLDDDLKAVIKDAAGRLTGFKRREYQAQITSDYFGGSARKAEREMGWGRECVKKGLRERAKPESDAQIIIRDAEKREQKIKSPASRKT